MIHLHGFEDSGKLTDLLRSGETLAITKKVMVDLVLPLWFMTAMRIATGELSKSGEVVREDDFSSSRILVRFFPRTRDPGPSSEQLNLP